MRCLEAVEPIAPASGADVVRSGEPELSDAARAELLRLLEGLKAAAAAAKASVTLAFAAS